MEFPDVFPVIPGGLDIALPPLAPVRQRFEPTQLPSPGEATRTAIGSIALPPLDGRKIAITAGSRGIAGYVDILRELVRSLRAAGAEPFVVPAMGSHGGATAEGQRHVLAGYGVTEGAVGAPIVSSMETLVIGTLPDGTLLHCDRAAAQADGIVLFNKIRPHTAYKAPIESGLAKMLVIGLGKHEGARAMHAHDFDRFKGHVPLGARILLDRLPVLFGLAVVENAWGGAARIEAVAPEALLDREVELLREAKRLMGRLLMGRIDVLIVDRIGKDISGAGMDPNVTGRPSNHAPGFEAPAIQKIVVRGLTQAAGGNGAGIGNADFTTVPCVRQLDLAATYTNVFSARVMQGAKLPVVLPNDRMAIAAALLTCNGITPEAGRVVRIRDTKRLDHVAVSAAVIRDIAGDDRFEVLAEATPMRFDDEGALLDA